MGELVLSAYGKLPLSEEYLRHNCYEGSARATRDWIDRCFDRGSEMGRIPDSRRVLRRWVLNLDGECVQLVLSPSIDGGGTRRFPFAVFDSCKIAKTDRFAGLCHWGRLNDAHETLSNTTSTDEFFSCAREFEARPIQGLQTHQEVLGETSTQPAGLKQWVDSLYRLDAQDLWIRALWHLEHIRPYLEKPKPANALLALHLPISRQFDEIQQVRTWCHYLARLHPCYAAQPSALLPKNGKRPAGVWLFFRAPTVADFSCSLGGELTREEGTDLVDDQSRLPVDGFSEFRKQVLAVLENGSGSWLEFGSHFDVRAGA